MNSVRAGMFSLAILFSLIPFVVNAGTESIADSSARADRIETFAPSSASLEESPLEMEGGPPLQDSIAGSARSRLERMSPTLEDFVRAYESLPTGQEGPLSEPAGVAGSDGARAEATSLPAADAMRIAQRFVPHYYWSPMERYYAVPVEWIDRYMPAWFPFEPGEEINWTVPFYQRLDVRNQPIGGSGNNTLALALGAGNTHHLGWGPRAVLSEVDGHTRVPFVTTEAGWRHEGNLPLDNLHSGPDTPVYFRVNYNADGNIEVNYRLFAYRDDIAFPSSLFDGVISDYFGGHWGDWEPNITIVLSPDETPLYAHYSAHESQNVDSRKLYPVDSPHQPRFLLWSDVRKDLQGHPAVLVAAKKHAAYFCGFGTSVPSLRAVASPSPFSARAPFRPQFVNKVSVGFGDSWDFLGYNEDIVGESFVAVPPFGSIYLGRHWVPRTLVNLKTAPWAKFTGKWGESPNSPSTPRFSGHTIEDFVSTYRRMNDLPRTAAGIECTDYFAPDGPRYVHDLEIADNSTAYHNVYYSVLRALGFQNTQSAYSDIRFRWWNDLRVNGEHFEVDPSRTTVHLTCRVRNSDEHPVLYYKVRWKAGEKVLAELERNLQPGEFPGGAFRLETLTAPYCDIPNGSVSTRIEVLGHVVIPPTKALAGYSFDPVISRAEYHVATDRTPPKGTPVLLRPVDGAGGEIQEGELAWTDVPNATSYRVELACSSGVVILAEDVPTARRPYSLPDGTYRWRVLANGTCSDRSPFSEWATFSVGSGASCGRVQIESPSDGTTCMGTDGVLRWRAAQGTDGYVLELGDRPDTKKAAAWQLADTLFAYSALDSGGVYYWRVKPNCLCGEYTPWMSFETVSAGVDRSPRLESPKDGARDLSTAGQLEWKKSRGAARYRVQIGENCGEGPVSESNTTELTYSGLLEGRTYYWRVCTVDDCGRPGPYSECRSFTTTTAEDRCYIPQDLTCHPGARGFIVPIAVRNADRLREIHATIELDPSVFAYVEYSQSETRSEIATGVDVETELVDSLLICRINLRFPRACAGSLQPGDGTVVNLLFDVTDGAELGASPIRFNAERDTDNQFESCRGRRTRPVLLDGSIEVVPTEGGRGGQEARSFGETRDLPAEFELAAPYPNPAREAVEIRFGLPTEAYIELTVHDVVGREVARLVHGVRNPGWHSVFWDGSNPNAGRAPAGIYIVRLTDGKHVVARRVLLLS